MTTITSAPAIAPRDATRTREAILRAAQKLFALKGYTTTGVREVAAEAGVDTALIRRYFTSKEGLLRATVEEVLQVEPFIHGSREDFGTRAVATLLGGDLLPNPMAIMLLATADPAARILCGDLMDERIVIPLAAWLGGTDSLARAARLNMLWTGFMTARHVLPTPSQKKAMEANCRWLAEISQAIADGDG